MFSRIYNLLNYCYEDSIINQFAGIEFQLFLISNKSLMPFEDKIGCMFNIERYKAELEILKYYKNGQNSVLDYRFHNNKPSDSKDELLEFKIIPIIISNTSWEVLIEQILKSVVIFTFNSKTIIDAIILSSSVNEYLNSDNMDFEDLNKITKENLIQFSYKEFLEKCNIEYNKKNILEFEKQRIKIISDQIFNDEIIQEYKTLQHILNENKASKKIYPEHEMVLNNFANYLLKLRKGIISPDKLKIDMNKIYDFKLYLKQSAFTHPLLGKCITIKRNDKEIILKNKSGLFKVIL